MRTKKDFQDKRQELASSIWNIFLEKGYENTTLSVIIKGLGISKGVFYHYFDSKESCAMFCASLYADRCVSNIKRKLNYQLEPKEQLMQLIQFGREMSEEGETQNINSAVNMTFHKMLMVELVKKLAPLYAENFEKGNETGDYSVKNPLETAEALLTLCQFYLDEDFFMWSKEEMQSKVDAYINILNRCLGVKEDISFIDQKR